ncbi:BTB/POZ and MATH domain-containing protein 3 [Hibiscus syriacus]|uniref:BTB/POZ and MATH domain-containing protein 3 n=1 Tax=Hibiscus syriacus TaxID=106335 RepID=A0A6A3B5J4_HIBSY|nr:BTB/POZ and MATH domain-containing protein 3 [Hibiscus syriacus]
MDDSEDSLSKSVSETVNGSHQFTIEGYSLAKGMGPGKCISSDIFTVGGRYRCSSNFLSSPLWTRVGKGIIRGYKRFFRRTTLEASDYINDDCIIMNCTVGIVRTRIEGLKQCSIHVTPSDMGQNLKALLESEIGCDLIFQVGDEAFKAHKLILAARSPVFRAQFFGLVGDPNMDKVVVKDVVPSVFKAMLLFIYTDKLPDIQEITGS